MVPKPLGSVVPAAAVTLPMTGGQNDKHEPVQFDFVGVSIANQYRVWPCEFTTTVPMPVWRVETVPAAVVAGAEVFACGVVLVPEPVLVLLGDELPHAVITAATPASTGAAAAHQRLRIVISPIVVLDSFLIPDYVAQRRSVQADLPVMRWQSRESDIGYR